MPRPDLRQVPAWYHGYIDTVEGTNILSILDAQGPLLFQFLKKIPEAKRGYRYAKGKWTLKELLMHLIDAERIFSYRALCLARLDKTSLPSFDENAYVLHSKAGKRNWDDLVIEFKAVRSSTITLFRSFDKAQLSTVGTVNNNSISVLGIGFIIAGHVNHHLNIIRERYLQ